MPSEPEFLLRESTERDAFCLFCHKVLVGPAIDPLISFYGHDSQSIEHRQRDAYARLRVNNQPLGSVQFMAAAIIELGTRALAQDQCACVFLSRFVSSVTENVLDLCLFATKAAYVQILKNIFDLRFDKTCSIDA
jgi:hypothetical protein